MLNGRESGVKPTLGVVAGRVPVACYKMTAPELLLQNRRLSVVYPLRQRCLPLCYKISALHNTLLLLG